MIHQKCGTAEPLSCFACHPNMDGVNSVLPKSKGANADQYGPEVLCANWIPTVEAVGGPIEAHRETSTGPAAADAEAFLSRFYRAQQG